MLQYEEERGELRVKNSIMETSHQQFIFSSFRTWDGMVTPLEL